MKSATVCFLLLVVRHCHTLENEQKNDCPADWTNSICSCKDSRLISCEGASDGKQIENAFRYTGNNNKFKAFNLLYSNVTKLPDGVFGKLSFESFNLVDNNLNTISRFAFKGSEETAKVIWLERNNFSPTFDLKFMFPLRQLNSVNIVESNLQTIATGAFGNLPNLEKINIQNNNLNKLGKFAFSLLPKLIVIDLSGNKLPKLEKNMFNTSHAQHPILVDLSHNEIQDIETDAFADLKTNSVNLAHNKLTTLNQDAFEPLLDSMKLIENSELQIEGNPITCDSRLDWLHEKPLAYRQQVKGLTCGEFTNEPETVPTPKSPERPKNCIYNTHSDQVYAFFHGHQLINRSPIPHLSVIKLRCSNVQNLKFVGKHVIQCLNGKFSDSMPDCVGLVPNSLNTAPPLWFTTYPPIYPLVTEEGILVVPRNSAVSVTCWWSQKKPDITVTGDAHYKSQKLAKFNKASGWTTAFNPINEIAQISYYCGVPGSPENGELTQELQVKISDSCRLAEKQIESRGFSIDPQSKKEVFIEGDRVDLLCDKSLKRGARFLTCKTKGVWEWGPEEDCQHFKVEEMQADVLPILHRSEISRSFTNCTYLPLSTQVEGFYHGQTLISGTPIAHADKIIFRCNNVQNMKFVGKHEIRCNDGRFDADFPNCIGLLPNDYNSAPPLWVRTDPVDHFKTSEDGVILVPRRSAIFVTCWWSPGKPDTTVTGNVEIRSQQSGTFNKLKGWVTEIAPVTEISQIKYTCSVPETKPGGILTQDLYLKVTDTCRLTDSQMAKYGLLIDPRSKKNIYVEEDKVYLLCGERMKTGVQFMTCRQSGKWDWGPQFDCSG